MLKIKRFICKNILGHKTSTEYTDSGYLICERCGSHEYYDFPMFNSLPLIYIPRYVFRLIVKGLRKIKMKSFKSDDRPF